MTKEEIINKIVALTDSKKQQIPLVPYSGQDSRKTVLCINSKTGETILRRNVDLNSSNSDSEKDKRQEKDTYQEYKEIEEANELIQHEIDALIPELWNIIKKEMNNLVTPSDKIFYLENLKLNLEYDGCYHSGLKTLLHDELKLWERKQEIWEKKQALNQQHSQNGSGSMTEINIENEDMDIIQDISGKLDCLMELRIKYPNPKSLIDTDKYLIPDDNFLKSMGDFKDILLKHIAEEKQKIPVREDEIASWKNKLDKDDRLFIESSDYEERFSEKMWDDHMEYGYVLDKSKLAIGRSNYQIRISQKWIGQIDAVLQAQGTEQIIETTKKLTCVDPISQEPFPIFENRNIPEELLREPFIDKCYHYRSKMDFKKEFFDNEQTCPNVDTIAQRVEKYIGNKKPYRISQTTLKRFPLELIPSGKDIKEIWEKYIDNRKALILLSEKIAQENSVLFRPWFDPVPEPGSCHYSIPDNQWDGLEIKIMDSEDDNGYLIFTFRKKNQKEFIFDKIKSIYPKFNKGIITALIALSIQEEDRKKGRSCNLSNEDHGTLKHKVSEIRRFLLFLTGCESDPFEDYDPASHTKKQYIPRFKLIYKSHK